MEIEEGSSSKGYKKKFAGTYQKAKQRVLNKLGKRTTLTRRPKIDSLSKEFEVVIETKESLEKRLTTFQHKLNSVVACGRDLRDTYLQLWKNQVGSLVWNNEQECYERNKSPSETRLIADLERAVYEQDRTVDDAMERFHAKLTHLSESPISLDGQREIELAENVKHAKKLYKECRTNYSDSVIDSHGASSSARSKEALAKQKYDSQAEVFAQEIATFLEHYRGQLPDRLIEFFEAEDKMITAVANAHAASMSMLGSLKMDKKSAKSSQRKRYEDENEEYVEQQSPSNKNGPQSAESDRKASSSVKKQDNWDLIYGVEEVDLNQEKGSMIDLQ
ncbi:uncharacterized protein Gasu_49150 [Galdieria sulphuraria]|uniref:BAR domain-containing protein n=1 Tax=Galdieria sulphuraria TaxID=130081 RepID=M2XUZ5_GALSU|nr:uncharacterized protein Gasu_49150 [Galdieria sulphuraria]EME27463.1 hypothetical protein Gasu_49150 [Galdieria sulphuraria]|eukprot:XP_005703983.1 hypothetical protein Gasu_49150 [Galdieria sulphuraria]